MIKFESNGLDLAEQKLSYAVDHLSDLRALKARLGELGKAETRQLFYEQRDPDGMPWAELQPETVRRKKGRKDKLMNKLDLINSITFSSLENGVFIHSSLPDSRVAPHQFGDPTRNIPRRAIFGVSASLEANLLSEGINYVEGVF